MWPQLMELIVVFSSVPKQYELFFFILHNKTYINNTHEIYIGIFFVKGHTYIDVYFIHFMNIGFLVFINEKDLLYLYIYMYFILTKVNKHIYTWISLWEANNPSYINQKLTNIEN